MRRYLHRFDNEVALINDSLRPGRPTPTRLDMLQTLQRREHAEYAAGTLGTCVAVAAAGGRREGGGRAA